MTDNRPILWTSLDAATALRLMPGEAWQATGVSIDSRTVAEGDLFIALSGPNHDGNDYVDDAFAKGAVAAIVSRPAQSGSAGPVLCVPDTMAALERLAVAARDRTEARIAAVTGSVGKTGTKDSLALALSRLGSVHKTEGNLNNHIGLPLTLARMPQETAFGVFELGMNHAGELDGLSKLVRPDIAVITTVEAVHLEFFDGVDAICDAKCEIFNGMTGPGVAVLNQDHPLFERMVAAAEKQGINRHLSFGESPGATVRLIDCSLQSTCSAVTAELDGQVIDYCLGAPGRHWVMNSLAVLATVRGLGGDISQAAGALSEIRAPKGRGAHRLIELATGGSLRFIDESYNASPASVRAAIAVLGNAKPGPGGRRILVLGDMLELGADAEALHASLAADIQAAGIDVVHCCGPMSAALHAELPNAIRGIHAADSSTLAPLVADTFAANDLVTVKGSLGSRMASIVSAIEALAEPDTAPRAVVNGR